MEFYDTSSPVSVSKQVREWLRKKNIQKNAIIMQWRNAVSINGRSEDRKEGFPEEAPFDLNLNIRPALDRQKRN